MSHSGRTLYSANRTHPLTRGETYVQLRLSSPCIWRVTVHSVSPLLPSAPSAAAR